MRNYYLLPALIIGFGLFFSHARLGAEDKPNYDFTLYDLKDNLVSMKSMRSQKGIKLVAVDFFSIDCEPCKEALPEWINFFNKNRDKGLNIIIVALPMDDDRDLAQKKLVQYFKDHPVPFPVAFDKYSKIGKNYGVVVNKSARLPQAFLLDKSGELIKSGKHDAIFPVVKEMLKVDK